MSVWAHVGAAELFRVWVHWLWFKKTNRMKGTGGWVEGEDRVLPLSYRARHPSGSCHHWARYPGEPRLGSHSHCQPPRRPPQRKLQSERPRLEARTIWFHPHLSDTTWLRSGCHRDGGPTAPLEEF